MLKTLSRLIGAAAVALPLAASAATTTYSFNLNAMQEVPANASPAAGSFQLTVDDVANTISFGMAAFNFQSAVTAAHIHLGLAGSNGPVQYNLLSNADSSGLVFATPNSFGFAGTNKAVGLLLADDINAAPWNYYVNVHTAGNPGGEIRGQVAVVPELESYAMLLSGLGLLAFIVRRRTRQI